MLQNTIAFGVAPPGKIDPDQYRAIHGDVRPVPISGVIGEFERKGALQAERTGFRSRRSHALQRDCLVKKLNALALTRHPGVLGREFSGPSPGPPQRQTGRRYGQDQKIREQIASHEVDCRRSG